VLVRALAVSVALAALSLFLVAPAPSYDPWAWLLWGRELTSGELSTEEGPAFKPLTVAVCALLAPFGAAAPWLWVLVARTGAVVAVWLAYRLAVRLSGGSRLAGGLAAAGVALCGGYLNYTGTGVAEPLLLAFALAGVECWRAGRMGAAIACGVACGLLRVEAWPFLVVGGALLWRRSPRHGPALAACAAAVPALWLVPELLASGDAFRSGARARIPNAGQPALEDFPALASLRLAFAQPLWPLWAGVAALVWWRRRAALAPAAAGLAWILVVAAMAQAGFSGESRYSWPGAALIAVSGAIGLAALGGAARSRWRGGRAAPPGRAPRAGIVLALGVVALAAVPRLDDVPGLRSSQAYQWRLAGDLADAVRAAGGRDGVLACGRPYVGRLRGPLMAYRLHVAKRVVEPDDPPRAPGVVFRSRLTADSAPAPGTSADFSEIAHAGSWRVLAACRS
jgi:hypothetical protein